MGRLQTTALLSPQPLPISFFTAEWKVGDSTGWRAGMGAALVTFLSYLAGDWLLERQAVLETNRQLVNVKS